MDLKLIFENWRAYKKKALLNEVSYEDALNTLDSKATRNAIIKCLILTIDKRIENDKPYYIKKGEWSAEKEQALRHRDETWFFEDAQIDDLLLRKLKSHIRSIIPNDLTNNQKGQTVLWAKRLLLSTYMPAFQNFGIDEDDYDEIQHDLEIFFHWQRFMEPNDLNKIETFSNLNKTVNAAEDRIRSYQEKQNHKDAEKGTEVLLDNNDWFIAAIHNKGAACQLGKGTDWCTAAPGLDYFKQYYDPQNPLIFFKDKKTDKRYQFSYAAQQFMDEKDSDVDKGTNAQLTGLLLQTAAPQKYTGINNPRSYNNQLYTIIEAFPELFAQLYFKTENKILKKAFISVLRTLAHRGLADHVVHPDIINMLKFTYGVNWPEAIKDL